MWDEILSLPQSLLVSFSCCFYVQVVKDWSSVGIRWSKKKNIVSQRLKNVIHYFVTFFPPFPWIVSMLICSVSVTVGEEYWRLTFRPDQTSLPYWLFAVRETKNSRLLFNFRSGTKSSFCLYASFKCWEDTHKNYCPYIK